jgi:hypothetical protein
MNLDDERDENGEQDQRRLAKLADYLRSKGMGDRDVRQACDLAARADLGPERSAIRGGAVAGGNFGGALHDERATDGPGLCAEEQMGHEPLKDRPSFSWDRRSLGDRGGRDSRRLAGDRMGFEHLYGLEPTLAAQQPRRPRTPAQIAMDAAARDGFSRRFPELARIGTSEHDHTAHRR